MLIVISPSKTLDFESSKLVADSTQPEFVKEAGELIKHLRKLTASRLQELMDISPKLAELNRERFILWQPEFTPETARQALFAFRGDVYTGMDADSFTTEDIQAAQQKLRILSGLYGILCPLDLIRPYRLEMGTILKSGKHPDLYDFWKKKITDRIRKDLEQSGSNLLINLASVEYFKAIDTKKLKAKIITPEFRDLKNGEYIMVSFWAKRARGMMTRYIIQNNITEAEHLQGFNSDGYHFSHELSKPGRPVFIR
jgi:cytoplasmic iron level regulating protein YaaA (DUF328/UPF0246 family)